MYSFASSCMVYELVYYLFSVPSLYHKTLESLVSLRAVPTGFEPAISALTGRHVEPSYTTGPTTERVYHRAFGQSRK
jgi:hypothetical protein